MAVDTRNRRAACIGFDFPSGRAWPNPDATLDQADRQHITYKYPGILASGAAVVADEAGFRQQQMAQWQGRRMSFY